MYRLTKKAEVLIALGLHCYADLKAMRKITPTQEEREKGLVFSFTCPRRFNGNTRRWEWDAYGHGTWEEHPEPLYPQRYAEEGGLMYMDSKCNGEGFPLYEKVG